MMRALRQVVMVREAVEWARRRGRRAEAGQTTGEVEAPVVDLGRRVRRRRDWRSGRVGNGWR